MPPALAPAAHETTRHGLGTRGGLPPAADCDPARVGSAVRVPYSADYPF